MNVQEVSEAWLIDRPKYDKLGAVIVEFIKDNITNFEILPEVKYRTKDLLSIIKKIKKKRKNNPEYSINSLSDKLGIRIICNFQEEMKIIDQFLNENFQVSKAEYKQDNLDFDRLDYISNHYDAVIKTTIKEFTKLKDLEGYVFEIQVRTSNQHAWSNTSHSLSYKQEAELPVNFKRKIYRLLSLYEIADDEFSIVNKALKEHEDSLVYSLLRKLEGKFYRFAKIDFDRDISLNDIKILLDFFENETEKVILIRNIDTFITSNEVKILRIFSENRAIFSENLFLTQPEIFVTWYMLTNHSFLINDKWDSEFDPEDLEEIKILWGNEL